MENQEIVIMEYKKDMDAPDREIVNKEQIIGEVVVETSTNNGQAVELEQQQNPAPPPSNHHHQHHHQTSTHHPQLPISKGIPAAPTRVQPQREHTRHQMSFKENEERVGITSAAAPAQTITVITAPKTRMINSSGNIREMTAEEREAAERSYEEIVINQQGHSVDALTEGSGQGHSSGHPYSVSETLPVTSIATTTQILVTEREIIDAKDQICITNHIIAHPGSDHNSATIYHQQVHDETGNEYYEQYNEQRSEHGTIVNREGQPVAMTAHYAPPYRYTSSPSRIATTASELKPIPMDDQQVAQEIHIYDGAEASQNPIANGQSQLAGDNSNMEGKLHYTNLDTTYITPEHYPAYAAANSGITKEYIFGPPGNVLYKDATLAYRPPYLYTMGQPMYESSPAGSGPSPSGQARFHSSQPYYNFENYSQVVLENDLPTEYQNGWASAPTGYEDHSGMTTITTVSPITKCVHCSSQNAPHYRTDPSGHLICSDCSVRTGVPAQPISRAANRSTKSKAAPAVNNNRRTGVVCANCNTTTTTLWRRNNSGDPVCNACGLYYKLHSTPRPIAMKKDGVQTRKRKPKNQNVLSNSNASKSQIREKVLPSMIPSSDPKLHHSAPQEIQTNVAASAGQEPPATQHYLPVHSQASGPIMTSNMSYVRPIRHVSPPNGVDTTRSGLAETTSVITSTGAPSGP